MIIVLVTTKEKSLGTDFNQENWMLVFRVMCPTGSDLFCLLFVAYYCPLLSVSKTHKKHEARQTLTFSDFSDPILFYYVIVIAEMIDDEKRTFFIHGSYAFAISQSYIKQCTNFQSQLLFDAFTILQFQTRMLNPQKCGLLGHLTECCYMLKVRSKTFYDHLST